MLIRNPPADRATIRDHVVSEGILPHECGVCRTGTEWHGNVLRLHLDNENGDPDDFRVENIRFLCPNCFQHVLEGRRRSWGHNSTRCRDCEVLINRGAVRCRPCYSAFRRRKGTQQAPRFQKADYPDPGDLRQMVRERGYRPVARDLGVSDNSVRRYLLRHGGLPNNIPYRSKESQEGDEKAG